MSSIARSPLVDESGDRIVSHAWEPPRGSSPYFGWLGDDGFTTVRIECIQAVTPHPQMRTRHVIWLQAGLRAEINSADAERLLKKMGWTEPGNVNRA